MWIERQQPHLSDQELLDWYLEHPGNGQAGRPLSPHIAACSTCAQRYAELAHELDVLTTDGANEADALFTTEVLAEQRQHVMRRIENHGRRADIFVFPRRGTNWMAGRRPAWHPMRWVAAAAVAGLAAGMGLGLSVERFSTGRSLMTSRSVSPQPVAVTTQARQARPAASTFNGPITVEGPLVEDVEVALLEEIESALVTRRVRELRTLDELTPEQVSVSLR
jgi:hypothetical protein